MEEGSRQNRVSATAFAADTSPPYPRLPGHPISVRLPPLAVPTPPLLPPFPRLHASPAGLTLQAAAPSSQASVAQRRYLADRKRRLSSLSGVSPPSARHRRPAGPLPTALSLNPHLLALSNAPSSSMTMNPAGHAASPQASASTNVIDLTGDDRRPQPSQPGQTHGPSPEYVLPKWQADSDVQFCPVCGVEFTFWNRKHHCR
jgi:hypothetical protein